MKKTVESVESVESADKAPAPTADDGSEQTPSWEYGSPAERYSFHDRGKRPVPPTPAKGRAAEPTSPAEDEGPPGPEQPGR